MRILSFASALFFTLAGCAEPTSIAPATYPSVNGDYDLVATFDNDPQARLVGQVRIIDDSRSSSAFTGSFFFRVSGTSDPRFASDVSGDLLNGHVALDGQFSVRLSTSDFRLTGVFSGDRITGTITLFTAASTYSGPFSAVRR